MNNKSRRTTIYFDPSIYQLLRLRAAESDNSVSDLANDLIKAALDVEPVNKEYSIPSSVDMRVMESDPVSVELTERVERLERRLGIPGDTLEAEIETTVLMTLNDVKERLASHSQKLKDMGVRSLAVFGSLAKQRFQSGSDIDLLVEYEQQAGLFRHIELQQELATLLQCEIDLMTARSLREELRDTILQEAVHVYPA